MCSRVSLNERSSHLACLRSSENVVTWGGQFHFREIFDSLIVGLRRGQHVSHGERDERLFTIDVENPFDQANVTTSQTIAFIHGDAEHTRSNACDHTDVSGKTGRKRKYWHEKFTEDRYPAKLVVLKTTWPFWVKFTCVIKGRNFSDSVHVLFNISQLEESSCERTAP